MKNKLINTSLIIVTFFLLTCNTTSNVDYAGLGKASDIIPLTSRAITGKLPSGLKYFIIENTLPENRVHLALVVNAGSVLERDDERGLAHFVEHLAFNDTERFPKMELIEYLRSLGMRFGADANAYTSYNETVYYFDVPVEIVDGVKKIPDKALAILDDWSHAVSFLPEDVKSESLVVLEELRTRLGAMDRVRKITLPILFEGSAYAQRDPIGLIEIIENASTENVKSFYDRWYTPDNMALAFIGDFDGKALEAEITRHFNMLANNKNTNRPNYELPPPKKNNFRIEIISDPELTTSDYSIYYKLNRAEKKGTLGYYRQTIIDFLIDTMMAKRFEEAETDPDSFSLSSWAGILRWASSSQFFVLGTQSKEGSVEESLRELLTFKEQMRRYGFSESELEMAKLDLFSYMEKQLSEKDRRDSRTYIRDFTSHFLYGEDFTDIEWEMNAVSVLLPRIGIKEISQTIKDYFAANDCIVFLTAPEAEKSIPSESRIKAIFKETASAKIQKRKSELLSSELLQKIPEKGKIINEITDDQTGAVILTMENGAKVILKQTANKNNEIILYSTAKGGTLNVSEDEDVSASMASEMIAVSGLGPYSRAEMINKLAGKQVALSFWAANYYRGFQGSATSKDLNTLFQMIYLFFTDPNFDEKAIAAMIDQYKTNLAHQDDDPDNYFSREISKIIYSNYPRFLPMELSDVEKISMQKAFDFINRCINPGDYTFVFTGNIGINEMKDLSARYIASLPNTESMNEWINPKITRPSNINKKLYKGKDKRSTVYLRWYAAGDPKFDESKNQTAAILSEYMDILLTDEIREKMSGVYSISAGASVSVIPDGEYRLSVYFQCAPERADELIKAVKDRITEIFTKPVNPDTFIKAKEALLMEHEKSLQRNLHIAQSYANSSVLYNTPLSRLNKRPDSIRAVKMQDIQDICGIMLSQSPVQVVMYPEGWK